MYLQEIWRYATRRPCDSLLLVEIPKVKLFLSWERLVESEDLLQAIPVIHADLSLYSTFTRRQIRYPNVIMAHPLSVQSTGEIKATKGYYRGSKIKLTKKGLLF